MRKKKKVKVIYIIAALWLLSTIGFPIFSIFRLLILGGISVAVLGFALARLSGKSGQNGNQTTMDQNQARSATGSTANANPYSSNLRYSAGPVNGQAQQPAAPEVVTLSARERRKLAKQAAKEAELARARAAEAAKDEAKKREEENKARAAAIKKQEEQSLIEKYNVPKRRRTGDAAIDKMIDDEEQAIAEMRRLDDDIEDEKLSAQIVHLEEVTSKIVSYVVTHPDKKNQVRRFFNYYLPTSIKLLNSYNHVDATGIAGTNIDQTKEQVGVMMDKALEAFDNQLDALYADEAMDVSTEIKVMESLLSQEGLAESDDFLTLNN